MLTETNAILASSPGGISAWLQEFIFGARAASDTAVASDGLFMMIFWLSVFFFVVLMGLMFWWTVKYRRRPGVPQQVSPHHNTRLEILWTVIPSSSLLVIFLLGFWGYMDKMVAPTGSMELNISAYKWAWTVTYPNGFQPLETKVLSAQEDFDGNLLTGKPYPVIYLPEDTSVNLRMSSQDVIHAFWIPAFRTKMDIYPNRYTGYNFTTPGLSAGEVVTRVATDGTETEIPGRDLVVFCAEYCGDSHSEMAAVIRVVPEAIYQEVINEAPDDPIVYGRILHEQRCAICHSVDGSAGTGPTWQNMYGYEVRLSDDSTLIRDDNYIRRSIYEPTTEIVAGYPGSMPSFAGQLDEEQLFALTMYMKSLSDRGGLAAEGEEATTDEQNDDPMEPGEATGGDES